MDGWMDKWMKDFVLHDVLRDFFSTRHQLTTKNVLYLTLNGSTISSVIADKPPAAALW